MPTPLTRQDVAAISDGVRNRIIEKLINRRDIQAVTDNARDRILNTINAFHVESQTIMRQTSNQNDQMWRRITTLESQVMSARQDVRSLTQAINRLYEMQSQQMNRLLKTAEVNDQI
jgi:Mg2+ and Co2+ transporter CorA